MVCFFQLFITSGNLLAFIVGFICNSVASPYKPNYWTWRVMFGFPIFISLFQLYMLTSHFEMETPRYYLARKKKDDVII